MGDTEAAGDRRQGTWSPTRYRPTAWPARIAQVLLAASAALCALLAVLHANLSWSLDTFDPSALAQAESLASMIDWLAIPQYLLLTIAGVAFLVWEYRLVGNTPLLGGGIPKWSPGLTVVWWFVPLADLVMPYLILRELWHRLRAEPGTGNILIAGWWVATVCLPLLFLLTFLLPGWQATGFGDVFAFNAAAQALVALNAGILVVIVWRLQAAARQREGQRRQP